MNRKKQQDKVRDQVILALFTAIVLLLAFTPIGLIDLPIIKATILHVPVIIGSVILGPKKGAFLGFVFGLSSIIKNTTAPSLLSFAFSPFIPIPGIGKGSVLSVIICFIPRILVGVTPYFTVKAAEKLVEKVTGKNLDPVEFHEVRGIKGVKEAVGTLIVEFDSFGKAPLVEQVTLEQMAERYKKAGI